MQLLAQASQLSKKGEIYQSQGNYDYAAQCYKKIIAILDGIIKLNSNDKQKVKQLKLKLDKYQMKFQEMGDKQKQKNFKNQTTNLKLSKLGFPTQKPLSQHQKIVINQTLKHMNNQPINLPLRNNRSEQVKKQQKWKQYGHINLQNNGQNKNIRNTVNVKDQYTNFAKKETMKEIQPDIRNLIIHTKTTFQDIVGMTEVKKTLEEAVIRPRKRPDLYSGIRAPPKGILLYGPPGNGKTFICKALANQSGCTFFALSASAVMNKLVGETQKMLRKIFQAAMKLSPSIIFIDQIDSILTSRSQNQNQASRRLKTQFLVLLDGISSPKGGQILVIGATNLPKQLDLAARRRFNKLIYIGMPDKQSRKQLLTKNLEQVDYKLSSKQTDNIVSKLQGYSASEITNIIKQVCMIPLRQITSSQLETVNKNKIRQVTAKDFIAAISDIPPLLTKQDLQKYSIKV